jgi:hypothetical protein
LLIEFALLDASQFVSIFWFVIHSHSANDLVGPKCLHRTTYQASQPTLHRRGLCLHQINKGEKKSSSYKTKQHLFLHSLHLRIIFCTCTPLFSKTYQHTIKHLGIALHNPHRLQTYEGINYTHGKQLDFSY